MDSWIFWLALAVSFIHIFEEYGWPGGFIRWMKAFNPTFGGVLTRDVALWINTVFIMLLLLAALLADINLMFSLSILGLLGWNVVMHLMGTVRSKRYSPGLITAVLLYLPIMVWGFWNFLASGQVTIIGIFMALLLGAAYQAIPLVYFALAAQANPNNR